MSDHFKESLVVQTNIEPGSDKSSFRPCDDVLHNRVMINEDNNNNNKTGRTMMMMTKSTVAAIHYNDDTTKTPVLSPPSSPELEICPDKGIYSNNNENDDDDDDIFQYKEKHQDDPLSESPKHFKEQELLDHESTSTNYFYRDFDTDKKKNNEDNADLVFQQQQQLPENDELIIKNNMNKEVPDYQSIITPPIDLTGFAKELYDNRLSIVHSRESKLILTEQDELEFAKLLEIRRKSQVMARQRKNDEKRTQCPPLPTRMTTSTRTQEEEEEYACEKIEWNEPIQKDLLPSPPAFEKEKESSFSFVSNKIVTTQQQKQSLIITTNDSNGYDIGATSMESSSSSSQATSSPVTTPVTHNTSSIISDSNNSAMVTTPIARSSLPSVSPKPTRSRGFSLQKLRNPIENTTSWLPKKKLARLSDNSVASASSSTSSSSSKSVKQQQKYDIYDDSDKILVEEEEEEEDNPTEFIVVEQQLEGEKRPSISTRSKSSSNASRSSRFKELMDMDLSQVATDIGNNKEPPPPPPAPTSDQQQQSSSPSPINNSSSAFNNETNPPSGSSRTMSLNLFGSLRSRARSQSTSSIKGLMRNFSTTNVIPQRNNNINQQQQSQSQQGLKKKRSHSALSPAALAVLKHNAQGHNKKKGSGNNNNNSSTTTTSTITTTTTNDEDDSPMNNNQSKGKRLLSQLLNTARLSRRAPKKVNMDEDNSNNNDTKNKRAQIVRRTIIYVQPDSENFLQNIEKNHIPPIPSSPIPSKSTLSTTRQKLQQRSSTPDSDEDQGSQQTATMITRQTSVKRQVSKRRNNSNTTNYDEEQQQQQQQRLEGVEVREMSDGTVVWGVVKKLGKRKSFFIASEDSNGYESKLQVNEARDEVKGEEEEIDEEDEEDEEQIEERVLTLMGLSPDLLKNYPNNINYESAISTTPVVTPPPIPKRSPHRLREQKLQQQRQQQQEKWEQEQATYISSYANRRDSSTTDVYYAHGATLPSLLEMIASDQEELSPKENPTVEEQLDEVMRSLGYTEGHVL